MGGSHGVAIGDELTVATIKTRSKIPRGNVLREELEELGQVRVEEMDANSSTVEVVSGSGFQIGNLVTKK